MNEWMTSDMYCESCGYEWVAVHPICELLQCRCGSWNEIPPIEALDE